MLTVANIYMAVNGKESDIQIIWLTKPDMCKMFLGFVKVMSMVYVLEFEERTLL